MIGDDRAFAPDSGSMGRSPESTTPPQADGVSKLTRSWGKQFQDFALTCIIHEGYDEMQGLVKVGK